MNPENIRAMELPSSDLPAVPNWLENYAWDAYDPERRISLYVHVGRWYRDPMLWRELILVCVDGESVYSRRNIGRLDDGSLVGASCLRLRCEEPMSRWHWQYHGPVLAGKPRAMMSRPPLDDVAILLDFDLRWQATSPMLDFGHGTEPGAHASHYEQAGTLEGRLSVDGHDHAFEGRAFRDHSRGPRVLDRHFNRHSWIHCGFSSGRTMASMIVETIDGRLGIDALFTVTPDGIKRYRFTRPLLWDTWESMTQPYVVDAIDSAGSSVHIECQPLFYYPTTLGSPMDLFAGQSNDFSGWRVFQMPTRMSWDGESGWGHTEFTLPASTSRNFVDAP